MEQTREKLMVFYVCFSRKTKQKPVKEIVSDFANVWLYTLDCVEIITFFSSHQNKKNKRK